MICTDPGGTSTWIGGFHLLFFFFFLARTTTETQTFLLWRNKRWSKSWKSAQPHIRDSSNLASSLRDFPFPGGFLIFARWKVKMLGVVYNKRGAKTYGGRGFFFKALTCPRVILKYFWKHSVQCSLITKGRFDREFISNYWFWESLILASDI